MDELTPDTRKLLKQLIEDYNSQLEPARRVFRVKDGASYIYNLFRSTKYRFSSKQYNELYFYIQKRYHEAELEKEANKLEM